MLIISVLDVLTIFLVQNYSAFILRLFSSYFRLYLLYSLLFAFRPVIFSTFVLSSYFLFYAAFMRHLLLVSATRFEIAATLSFLDQTYKQVEQDVFLSNSLRVSVVITGVGGIKTSVALLQSPFVLSSNSPIDLALQVGIAGAYRKTRLLGELVEVVQEQFGDIGAMDDDFNFHTIGELGFEDIHAFPFEAGCILNHTTEQKHGIGEALPKVAGNSVNMVNGQQVMIQKLVQKFPRIEVETMEGAAFFYACKQLGLPFCQIRAISNYVEPRNRANWKVIEAVEALNTFLVAELSKR